MDGMRERLIRVMDRARTTFGGFTAGQKAVVAIGTIALIGAAIMVVRWASTPTYAPLYSNLAGPDASAVVDELQAEGVSYKITGGGGTIMVPQSDVYSARIALSGKGLPGSSDGSGGYSILDNEGLSTSEFAQQTDFKRAMEGELAKTIEAIDGIDTAIVHLAIPQKQVFSDEQNPATASVLVGLSAGTTLTSEQVQAITNLTSSSIDGLQPKNVTITDQHGNVLSSTGDGTGLTGTDTQAKGITAFTDTIKGQIQGMLDKVVGPGNSTITVTPVLDFDQASQVTRRYLVPDKKIPPLSESHSAETYNGNGNPNNAGGVVGPDGQMDPTATGTGGPAAYKNSSDTQDNAIDTEIEHRVQAPGSLKGLHVSVVLNQLTAAAIQPSVIRDLVSNGVGIDTKRGDTIDVAALPFDHSAADAAAKELAAASKAQAHASQMKTYRYGGIGILIAFFLLLAWFQERRRAKARAQATEYVVEQIRTDQAQRLALEVPAPTPAIEAPIFEPEDDRVRDDLLKLVERQPADVAALLRGWLVEPR